MCSISSYRRSRKRVVAANDMTARWAARPVDLGGDNVFSPMVLGPAGVPQITDETRARSAPELAVLSAIAHGRQPDASKAAEIALAAQSAALALDEDRARLYFDLVLTALSEAARQELRAMDPAKYEYQSDFAKHYIALGRAEGRAEGKAEGSAEGELRGRAALLQRLLSRRFGPLPPTTAAQLAAASIDELDTIAERLLSAKSLDEALGSQLPG